MTTTVEELEQWMSAPRETESLEFKSARSGFHGDRLMDYCVGICNDGGGKLILGVTNDPPREVVGTAAISDTHEMQKKILDKLHFEVKIEEIDHSKGRVVVCHIPTRPPGTAVHHDGRYWMRSGEELRAMSPDRLRQIFEEGKPDWLNRRARTGLSASEVISLLDTRMYFERLGQPYPATPRRILERLHGDKLVGEDSKDPSLLIWVPYFRSSLDGF